MPNIGLNEQIVPYDVKLNSKKYLIIPGTYQMSGVRESMARPGATHGGDPNDRSNEDPSWAWWSQTLWQGDGVDDWSGDGGFVQATGLDLFNDGQATAAAKFFQGQSSTGTDWLFIPLNNTTIIAINKDTGRAYTATSVLTWTDRGVIGGAGATSWTFYKGTLIVALTNGDLRTTTDGITWSAYPILSKPSSNACYLLGVYRSKLYLAWSNDLRTWDGTTLTVLATVDGTPIAGAVGQGVLFIIAQGTPGHIYMAQADQFVELMQFPSDFQVSDCIFMDTLYVSGGTLDTSGGFSGEIWRLVQNGLEFIYEVPRVSGSGVDYRIYSMYNLSGLLYFSYNSSGGNPCGLGIYDPTLDIFVSPRLGSYIGPLAPAASDGLVKGIGSWKGSLLIGIGGRGIYYTDETTKTDFKVTSSLFGSESKRINKMWGWCEITTTALTTGQSVLVEYSIDGGGSWTTLGTHNVVGATKAYLSFPANFKSPFLQYRFTGTANSVALAVLDISFSYIEASSNPKRIWRFQLGLQGSADKPMKYRDRTDFERTALQMKSELDALWNTRFSYEDITGTTYNVVMPHVGVVADDIVRTYDQGEQSTMKFVQIKYEVTLVET